MNIAPCLETERLTLVPMTPRDLFFFWSLLGSAEVRRFLGGPVPWRGRIAQFRQYLVGQPGIGSWVVKRQGQKNAIGLMVLSPHKDGGDYEVSYAFLPASWGQGFAREATTCVVEHAIQDVGLARVIAETQSANLASCRLLSSVGFAEESRLVRFGAQQIIFVAPS